MEHSVSTSTPWGPSQQSKSYGPGIVSYSCAGHGGFHVSPTLNAAMPDYLRYPEGWYEEDCAWALVALAFPPVWFRLSPCAEAEAHAMHRHRRARRRLFSFPKP